ncbi:putative ribonuclease H-like domain-containing protein [Tanacetum coccineum]
MTNEFYVLMRNLNTDACVTSLRVVLFVHVVTQQEEGINYDEVFAPVARIEAIRLFLAYVSFKDFMVYQIDVKSAFLYGKIEEGVYVCQPLGFEDPDFPDRVYKAQGDILIGLSLCGLISLWFNKEGYARHWKCDKVYRSQDCKTPIETQILCARIMMVKIMRFIYIDSSHPTGLNLHDREKDFARYLKVPRNRDNALQIPQQSLEYVGASSLLWTCALDSDQLLRLWVTILCIQVLYDNNLLGKAKKSVKLMMEKLFRMELELVLFWSTVKAKTINGEEQLHALVDGKKIIITESSVRRDLQLADEEVSKSKDYCME